MATTAPTRPIDAAAGCSALAEYGEKHKIDIICENHGGPSSNPDALLALIKAVNSPRFGTLPDFGNFPNKNHKYDIDVYEAIARMMPHAKGVSAKSYDFGPDGKEKHLDYARIMKIVTDSGYHSWVGIEYEGSSLSRTRGDQGDQGASGVAEGFSVRGLRTMGRSPGANESRPDLRKAVRGRSACGEPS